MREEWRFCTYAQLCNYAQSKKIKKKIIINLSMVILNLRYKLMTIVEKKSVWVDLTLKEFRFKP